MRRARSRKNSIAAVCICTILLFLWQPVAFQIEKVSKELIQENPVAPKHSSEIQTEAFRGNLNDSNTKHPKDRNHAFSGHGIEFGSRAGNQSVRYDLKKLNIDIDVETCEVGEKANQYTPVATTYIPINITMATATITEPPAVIVQQAEAHHDHHLR